MSANGDCPGGCGRKINTGRHVLCRYCWPKVPRDVQQRVYDAWERVNRSFTTENVQAHRAAKDEAIAAARRARGADS